MSDDLTRDEMLVLLIEECGELIQAATKCLRFGYDVDHGVGYGNNKAALSKECGDVAAVIAELDLDPGAYLIAKDGKMQKARANKAMYGVRGSRADGGRDGD